MVFSAPSSASTNAVQTPAGRPWYGNPSTRFLAWRAKGRVSPRKPVSSNEEGSLSTTRPEPAGSESSRRPSRARPTGPNRSGERSIDSSTAWHRWSGNRPKPRSTNRSATRPWRGPSTSGSSDRSPCWESSPEQAGAGNVPPTLHGGRAAVRSPHAAPSLSRRPLFRPGRAAPPPARLPCARRRLWHRRLPRESPSRRLRRPRNRRLARDDRSRRRTGGLRSGPGGTHAGPLRSGVLRCRRLPLLVFQLLFLSRRRRRDPRSFLDRSAARRPLAPPGCPCVERHVTTPGRLGGRPRRYRERCPVPLSVHPSCRKRAAPFSTVRLRLSQLERAHLRRAHPERRRCSTDRGARPRHRIPRSSDHGFLAPRSLLSLPLAVHPRAQAVPGSSSPVKRADEAQDRLAQRPSGACCLIGAIVKGQPVVADQESTRPGRQSLTHRIRGFLDGCDQPLGFFRNPAILQNGSFPQRTAIEAETLLGRLLRNRSRQGKEPGRFAVGVPERKLRLVELLGSQACQHLLTGGSAPVSPTLRIAAGDPGEAQDRAVFHGGEIVVPSDPLRPVKGFPGRSVRRRVGDDHREIGVHSTGNIEGPERPGQSDQRDTSVVIRPEDGLVVVAQASNATEDFLSKSRHIYTSFPILVQIRRSRHDPRVDSRLFFIHNLIYKFILVS